MDPFTITPTPKQTEFITTTSRYSCFSGGFGSGKTMSGCIRALLLSTGENNNIGLIGRMTYVELRDTTRKTFFEVCPPEYYDSARGGRWSPSENSLKLINGSEILFRHLDTISEKELLSLNLGWFYIDQAEEISENVFRILESRLRLNRVANRFGFITCNPEPGNWIYSRFVKPQEEGRETPNYHLINSTTHDNPYLPPDYVKSLIDSYPEEMRKRYIEGRWDVFENQIYKEFDQRIHVIKPFQIPDGWERIVAVDHGMVNPTAALWGAIDYDGNIIIYDEYYQPGIVSEHAKNIIDKSEGKEISMWVIDPATQAKTREKNGMPWSVIEEYEDAGLFFSPANNEKLAGINRVKEFLKLNDLRRHMVTRKAPAPRMYIFQNCINLVEELKGYQWRKYRSLQSRNAPEEPRDFNDHAVDALRYMIMARFPAPARRMGNTDMILPYERRQANSISKQFTESGSDEMLGSYYPQGDPSPISNLQEDSYE